MVREIFARYAAGQSHRRIAGDLNRRRVPPPRGKSWSATTIYGDTLKGVGMLVNATYTGRLTWNRSRWERDPDTGRRRRLARPELEWITTEAPELRIVDERPGTWPSSGTVTTAGRPTSAGTAITTGQARAAARSTSSRACCAAAGAGRRSS